MKREITSIPVGTQFSPNVINLPEFIQALVENSGQVEEMLEAIWSEPVNAREETGTIPGSRRRALLPIEAASQYGLLEKGSYEVTEFCLHLHELEDETELYDDFARHVLLGCGGLRVLEAIEQMRLDGLKVSAQNLARYLSRQGFNVAESNTAINSLRLWLAQADVLPEGHPYWQIDHEKKEQLVGLDDDTIVELASLTEEQREFLLAFCRRGSDSWVAANEIRDLAELKTGIQFERKGFVKRILSPLVERDLIEVDTGGTASGKSSRVQPTEQYERQVLEPFLDQAFKQLNPTLTAYYKERPEDIFEALDSTDRNVKGKALEAFAVLVMRLLGLQFVAWRKRAPDTTAQSEIDVLMAGLLGGIPTRWQVQCKNTPSSTITVDTVAKEVGLLPITKATHLLVIGNCRVSGDARFYARQVMNESHVSIFVLDHEDFDALRGEPAGLAAILRGKAKAMTKAPPRGRLWSR